ncbi:hypothetical protein [Myxosarcina sp. GI1(2024)]
MIIVRVLPMTVGAFRESGQTSRRRKTQGNADQDTPLRDLSVITMSL